MSWLRCRLRKLACRHSWRPWDYIFGDGINIMGCRAILRCQKCGMHVRARMVP